MPITTPQPRSDPKWVEARFDRIARSYWLFERLFIVPRSARTRAIGKLGLGPDDRVLTVGCGSFPELCELSTLVGPEGAVVGIDLSEKMLRRAYAKKTELQLNNTELIHANIFNYTNEQSFNAIYFPYSLTSFGEPHRVLRHIWDLLEPGGRLVVLDAQIPAMVRPWAGPAMPLIRSFMERTVVGDPDMEPLAELKKLGSPVQVEYMRGGAHFIAQIEK
ncbi:MAG: methyltransferase domain-containing protein [Flavobacteriales bacterium]|nr:methyltransferase domain-containing protein [Flavobacteriales bacterium]